MTMDVDEENISDTNLEKLTEITNKLNRCNNFFFSFRVVGEVE